jgi:hypothetical protein
VDKVQISARIFIETRKNPTKLFDPSDETLDPIAFFTGLSFSVIPA